jgi:hypothetical protein
LEQDEKLLALVDGSGLTFPLYARRLSKKSDWYGEANREELAAIACLEANSLRNTISLFKANNVTEFAKIIIAFATAGGRAMTKFDIVVFYEDELIGLEQDATDGSTNCGCANSLHVSVYADRDERIAICSNAMKSERESVRLSDGFLNYLRRIFEGKCCAFEAQVCTI